MKFIELNLDDKLLKGITDAGYEDCLPVQEKTFVHTFNGKDVYVQSQTGTGKTAAFLISIFQQIQKEENKKGKKALVVAPTRELAEQIGDEAKLIGSYTGIRIGTFYGGIGYTSQEKLLKDGVDVIIGTPGRLIDFCRSGKLNLKEISILVIDEADRLFDMGFLPDLKTIIRMMPEKNSRQTMLYSATLDRRVKDIADEFMNKAVEVEIPSEMITVDNVTQKLYHVGSNEKINLLLGILKTEEPKNAIIFTNTKRKAVEISERLKHNDYNCQYIIGDLPQKNRLDIIDKVKSGKIPILIATDVASRGLHIEDLEMVINYDLPENCESYVHRIGRTARVGKSGKAISLVCDKYVYGLEAIESFTKMKIPVQWADENLYIKDKAEGKSMSSHKTVQKSGNRRIKSDTYSKTGYKPDRSDRKKTAPAKIKSTPRRETPKPKRNSQEIHESKPKLVQRPERIERPRKNASLDERLAFYSQKYGDEFIVVTEPVDMIKAKSKKRLINKLLGFFKKTK
jgi:ATP-dependent RNA helicase RhlB